MFEGPHRYLRAYLAGIAFPTAFLAVLLLLFVVFASLGTVAWSAGELLVFPMAVVPNLWGLWNLTYLALSRRFALNLGVFGAVLPFIIAPFGYWIAKTMGHLPNHGWGVVTVAFLCAVVAYYLVWKHVVRFLNESLDLE